MVSSAFLNGLVLSLVLFFQGSSCSKSKTWPAHFNKIPMELDVKSKASTYNYQYMTFDDSERFVALNNTAFSVVKNGKEVMWTAADNSEYASQVILGPCLFTLILLDGNVKHYRFDNEGLVEAGYNEIPTSLYIDYKVGTYEYECSQQSNSYVFQTKRYYRFKTIREGKQVIFEAKKAKECGYLVVLRENELTLYQLNGNIKYFKLLNHGWVQYSPVTTLPQDAKRAPSEDFSTVSKSAFMEGIEKYDLEKLQKYGDLVSENEMLKNKVGKLDKELSSLKYDYEKFRGRILSVDRRLSDVLDTLFTV